MDIITEQQGYDIINLLNQIKCNLDSQERHNVSAIELFDKLNKLTEELKNISSDLFGIKLQLGDLVDLKKNS